MREKYKGDEGSCEQKNGEKSQNKSFHLLFIGNKKNTNFFNKGIAAMENVKHLNDIVTSVAVLSVSNHPARIEARANGFSE
jgi:hypothetical protein